MTERFALFAFHMHEASGGVDDLEHIGTLEECISKAEAEDRQYLCQIARMSDLKIVRRGGWEAKRRSDVTGLTKDSGTHDWKYCWSEVD